MGKSGQFSISASKTSAFFMIATRMLYGIATSGSFVLACSRNASEPKATTSDHLAWVLRRSVGTAKNVALVLVVSFCWGATAVELHIPDVMEADGCGTGLLAPDNLRDLAFVSYSSPGLISTTSASSELVGSLSNEATLGGKGSREPNAQSIIVGRLGMVSVGQCRRLHNI